MDHYYTYLLLSILATAVHFVWISFIMKRSAALSSLQVLAFSHLIAAGLLIFIMKPQASSVFSDASLLLAVGMVGLLMWLTRMLYYYAYSQVPVGDVAILSTFTPVVSIFFATAMGYPLSPQALLGILLISGSIYGYFCYQRPAGETFRLLAPLKAILRSKPLRYALFSTIPPAWAIVFHKQAVELSDPFLVSFWICQIIGVLSLLTLALRPPVARASAGDIGYLLVAGVLQATMVFCISSFLQSAHPSSAQALLRLAILLQMVLAWLFLKERFSVKQHAVSSVIAVIGVYLIISSRVP